MKTDIKTKWVAALRSDEYRQATSVLYDPRNNAYCCLGVLCKIMGAEWEDYNPEPDDIPPDSALIWANRPVLDGKVISEKEDETLSQEFLDEIGLSDDDESKLINMNDNLGADFAKIADFIEKIPSLDLVDYNV